MNTKEAAETLAAEIANQVEDLAVVSIDPQRIAAALAAGSAAITIEPPKVDLPTFNQAELTFQVHLIGTPPTNYLQSWECLDSLATAIDTLIDSIEPTQYRVPSGALYPCYTATITQHYDL